MSVKDTPCVSETINFASEELKILELWRELKVFRNCLKQSNGKPTYVFFDGPPFATGLPHYGHITAATIKDVVTRYAHQKGFHVERRFGWDCHGLPVEFEIDKAFDIKGPNDIIKMGIDKYNSECRKIVTRYVREWRNVTERIGRWVDFENDYKTLYPWYMESVWWVFKELYNKGLVYEGNKVMPYSTACNTPLSNFECGQNYKEVTDPAVTVNLPLVDDDDEAGLLIWTTTPWTLPCNLSVCVNPNLTYARIRHISTKKTYILLENRIESVFKKGDYEKLGTFPGDDLRGKKYTPIFDYYKEMEASGAFRVLIDAYVSAECGTGVVHQAPYFGEDDYRVCLREGIITKNQPPICPVDEKGHFVKPVVDFEGHHVKDADNEIIALLKQKNLLINQTQIVHSYPFCWRSETPLIYRSISSWFIRVEDIIERVKETNRSTNWVPEFVKEKRFGNWLNEARDWAISRNRYWGTPIPIWRSPTEICCIGSIDELQQMTGQKITDLHRDFIDKLEIPSKVPGNQPLKRIPEVFDCWFESGSMPYAQNHYPFENRGVFEENFPADFIAEGIDQTRGWFYTLLVISTGLFGKPPFKNLIANGLVLAGDGQKMSKRKKNYPDPMEIINKYGADALRLYLTNSPVVRAENLNFKESGVYSVIKSVFLPWYNAFRFLFQNVECYNDNNESVFNYDEKILTGTTNVMDKWIMSFTHSLLIYIHKEMEVYHLYNVLPRLTKFFDHLTNCYVRFNRKRMKGEGDESDSLIALSVLLNILFNVTVIMAPFAPFITETMYQHFKKLLKLEEDSVHYLMMPKPNTNFINEDIEKSVSRMQIVIELGRVIRDKRNIPIRYPLLEIVVIHQDIEYLQDVQSLQKYVLSELNIRTLIVTTEKSKYGITLRAEANYKMLGSKLKQHLKEVTVGIKALTDMEITNMIKNGCREIKGHLIQSSEINVLFKSTGKFSENYEMQTDNNVFVLINVSQNNKTQEEGAVRELITHIQKLRKRAHLTPTNKITVHCTVTGNLEDVIKDYKLYIENATKTPLDICEGFSQLPLIILEVIDNFKQTHIRIGLTPLDKGQQIPEPTPVVRWINVQLLGLKSKFCNDSKRGLLLLETGPKKLSLEDCKSEISELFGLKWEFKLVSAKTGVVISTEELHELSGETIFVCHKIPGCFPESSKKPFCKILNFVKEDIEGTLILENPAGNFNVEEHHYEALIDRWVDTVRTYPKLFEY